MTADAPIAASQSARLKELRERLATVTAEGIVVAIDWQRAACSAGDEVTMWAAAQVGGDLRRAYDSAVAGLDRFEAVVERESDE